MMLDKCKECLHNKCLIGIALVKANKEIEIRDNKLRQLNIDAKHYRKIALEIEKFGIKYTLSKS